MNLIVVDYIVMSRMKHAEHVAMHTNIRDIINAAVPSKIGLAQLVFNPYLQAIAQEQDIVNKYSGSAITVEMEKADQERDNVFRRIRRKLEVCKYENPTSEAYKASEIIEKHLLTQYTGSVPNMAMQEETSTLSGFVMDCRNFLTGSQVDAIGIDGDLDELEEANQKFSALYQQRVAEKADSSAVNALQLRAATDVAYNQLVVALNALGNDPDSAKAEQVNACRSVIANINVVISEAKQRLNQRLSGAVGTVTDVVFDGEVKMPALLNDVDHFQVVGTKLTSGEMKLTLIEQVNGKPGQVLVKSLDQFSVDYNADFELLTDPETGIMTVNVSDWQISADRHLTLTAVSC